jgi:hypothetical protein
LDDSFDGLDLWIICHLKRHLLNIKMNENWRVKCEYLQQEVESLKQQLKDSALVNDLNKRALAVCYNPNNMQTDNESKAAVFLLHHIMEENNILRK